MPQPSKEPCKKEACDIQACLTKNNFNPQRFRAMICWPGEAPNIPSIIPSDWQRGERPEERCLKVIELLQSCCEKFKYNSTHCASLSGLLKTNTKKGTTNANNTDANKQLNTTHSKAHSVINA